MAEEPKTPLQGPQEGQPSELRPALDEASASLAEALQTSFRVLTFLIVLLLGLFFARGFVSVQSGTKAIILRFGRTDLGLVMDPGLHYALPYPIDTVEIVAVSPRKLEVNTFWPVTTEAARTSATEKGAAIAGPVLGAEGASMLTGDRNILEARWDITYRVHNESAQDVINFYKNIGQEKREARTIFTVDNQVVHEALMTMPSNEELLIRTAVQSAVVREMSRQPVSQIYPQRSIELSALVKDDVNQTIGSLNSGLVVDQVNIIDIRPPEKVKDAFEEVLQAKQQAQTQSANAESDREKMLISAAGEVGVKLGDAIEDWWAAKTAHNTEEVQKSDARVRELFASKLLGGQVRTTIAEANAYKTAVVQSAEGDAAQVQALADLLKTAPHEVKIFLDHARVDALQEVLANAYETFLYHPDSDNGSHSTLNLWLSRRAELLRELKKVQETR